MQFPRNFLVANVTRNSLTCYEDVVRVGRVIPATRMLATFRLSRHVNMVWRVADVSATSYVSCSWNLENDTTNEQTGK